VLSQKLPVASDAGVLDVSRSLLILDSVLLRSRYSHGGIGFQGWRLCLSKRGTTFTKYYSDKQHGGQRKALKAASCALAELKELLDGSRLVNGKLSKAVISKAKKLLAGA
jgi:hypothetical protein